MLKKYFSVLGTVVIVGGIHSQQFSNTMTYRTSILQLNSLVVNDDGYEYEGIPYQDHIMVNDRQQFIYHLIYKAGEDNKPVYQAGTTNRLTANQVLDLYCWYDTTQIVDPITLELRDTVFRGCSELQFDIESIQFNETWSYNKTGSLMKKVNYLEPLLTVYNKSTGEEIGPQLLFRQQGGWLDFEARPITKLIKYRVLIKDTASIPAELMNETERNAWVNMVRSMALNGKLKVYDAFVEDYQLKKEEVEDILTYRETVSQYRPYPPYELYDTVYVYSKWDQISAIDFYESWSFDKKGNLIKEVLAYKPMAAVYDPSTAEFRGFLAAFLVYNNEAARKKLWDMNFIWKKL